MMWWCMSDQTLLTEFYENLLGGVDDDVLDLKWCPDIPILVCNKSVFQERRQSRISASRNMWCLHFGYLTVSFRFRPHASFHHTVDFSCIRRSSLIAGEWGTANITIRIHRFRRHLVKRKMRICQSFQVPFALWKHLENPMSFASQHAVSKWSHPTPWFHARQTVQKQWTQ